ncbi:peptidase M75, Imelysin [Nitratireductor sp. CAU 1489]|uniref:Peptidase M75, Imelysin n=1 Tax=Nitratireductor arenosus TaxID=2682096 RepID=A0A844QFD7_9HYPH|nr:imelysin family protein [Nitratireductor arenosus]MVA96691.1 peptidase M75, Imelysin [Nitratireductor arenosus]
MIRPLVLALCLGLALPATAFGEPAPAVAIARAAIDAVIRPGYARLQTAAETLEKDVRALCDAPGPAQLETARAAFRDTALAWASIEMVGFGPVRAQNRLERILFWPDRRGIGLRQVQAILATRDDTATDAAALAQKSVAVQGLGALDYVLYGTGAEELAGADGFRCRYGAAIGANLAKIAADITAGWADNDGIAGQLAEPGPDNALFRDQSEALGEVTDMLIHGLEQLRDVRLNGFLGETPDKDRPKRALLWRAGLTVATIRANLDGLRDLFDKAGFADHLAAEDRWIAASIRFEFAQADGALSDVPERIADTLADAQAREKLAFVRVVSSSLSQLVSEHLTAAYGLTAGFSSLDGD